MGVLGLHSWAESRGLGTRCVLSRTAEERVMVVDACSGSLKWLGSESLTVRHALLLRVKREV
jgi:hypothetical protein